MKKIIAILLVLGLCGCSGAQLRQEILGISIADVKNSKTRQTQQYDISSDVCVAKIKEMLSDMKAIVRENTKQKFIVADNLQGSFRSSIDTTQVGILVTAWEADKSQVDVASGNADLAAFVSKKISEKLKGPDQSQALKEEQQAIK
ncbi:MAG: hypothetical protein Q8R38_08400 [Candidatus Omnitrophota bacterium]|nr:hypothetical protein [Candidatus Omnitrophota bacterium]